MASAVTVTLADFSGGGAISDKSTFNASRGNLSVLQSKLGQSQSDFVWFVVGPPLKPLPDERKRKSDGSIIPHVAEIQINPPVSPGDIEFDDLWSRVVLKEAKERQVRDAVESLVTSKLLSLDVNGAFSLVLVRKDFKDWLRGSFEAVFQAVLAQKDWQKMSPDHLSPTSVTPQITTTTDATATVDGVQTTISVSTTTHDVSPVEKITENYYTMLLESMVADFTLGERFHCGDVKENGLVTCLDHLLLKLWTFAHWVSCERFCGYNHSTTPLGHEKFKEHECPQCGVKSFSMSFFSYYSRFSRGEKLHNPGKCWITISKNLLKAALKLPRANDVLYRGMKPPLEGVSFRTVKKDTWRSDAENPQAYDDPLLPPPSPKTDEVEKKIDPRRHFQENRDLFLKEDSRGLSDVQPGDLFLPDKRISSYSSDPGTAMRYSSIEGQSYPSTVIIVEDGFGFYNQFTIVSNVRELRDAELQVCPDDEFVVTAVQRDALWRQRFVESGSGVEPVWSVAQYHIAPEVGVAAVPYISINIDPTDRIEVYVFKRTGTEAGPTNASEYFERWTDPLPPFEKNGDTNWWTLDMGSRHISHIVKIQDSPSSPSDVSQKISVHFHRSRCDFDKKEKGLHAFSFENKSDRQQYPREIQTVRDTMVLKWLINLNTSPGHMLQTLPQIGPARRDDTVAERQSGFFRDLDNFQARVGNFPREEVSTGRNRRGIQSLVTFGSKGKTRESSPTPPASPDVRSPPKTPDTIGPKPSQSRAYGSSGSLSTCAVPSPPTVLLANGQNAEFCLMGNKETARKALEEVLSRLGCDCTLEKVKKAAGGDPKGNSAGKGGLDMHSLESILPHFRLCVGKYGGKPCRDELICLLRELLTSFGIPY